MSNYKMMQDSNGNYSSKRIGTFMLIFTFVSVTIELLICSPLHVELANKDLLMKVLEFAAIGAGAGFATCAAEYFGKNKNKEDFSE